MPAVSNSPRQPRPRRFRRVVFAGLLLLTLFVLMPAALYLFNNRAFTLNIPTPTPPADNAYDEFVRAGKLAQGMKHQTPANMSAPPKKTQTFANYKVAAVDFAPALTVIHNALGKPCLRPPARTIMPPTWTDNALFRNLARNISGAGRYEQLAKHPLQAADIWLDGVEMSAMLKRGGGLSDNIVANACQSLCLAHFEELLPHCSVIELRHISTRMTQINSKEVTFSDTLLEEGYTSVASMEEALIQSNAKQRETPLQMARGLIQADSDKPSTREEATQIAQFVFSSKERMLAQILDYYRAVA